MASIAHVLMTKFITPPEQTRVFSHQLSLLITYLQWPIYTGSYTAPSSLAPPTPLRLVFLAKLAPPWWLLRQPLEAHCLLLLILLGGSSRGKAGPS